jgi:hypothetical protein
VASTPSATINLKQLYELLRIESVSSDGAHPRELRAAADWVADLIGGATVTGSDCHCVNQNCWFLNISASRYIEPVVTGAVTVTLMVVLPPGGTSAGSVNE